MNMRDWACWVMVFWLHLPTQLMGQTSTDVFDFFEEEARVITASRQPTTLQEAPATVHVVTAQDIQDAGAQTIWDALRLVPGVDVMIVQTFQGEVGIRGLNKVLNNRVLVLLDGKPMLSGYFERVNWEYFPVGLTEIHRIEVVIGPVSALYGPNAIGGVINVITKTPEQISDGIVQIMAGDYRTFLGNAIFGMQTDHLSGKVSAGWRSTRLLEDADDPASRVGHVHGLIRYDLQNESSLSVRGGLIHLDSRNNVGGLGSTFERGPSGYLRADYLRKNTRVYGFWSRNATLLEDDDDFANIQFDLDFDRLEFNLEQDFQLPYRHFLTIGGSVRSDRVRSAALSLGLHKRTLSSLFVEDYWRIHPSVSLVLSGRWDHHSAIGQQTSPRASIIWHPIPEHTFRLSAGTSFRFPTITECELNVRQQFALSEDTNLPFDVVALSLIGNSNLQAEKMRLFEAAYTARFKQVQFMATTYAYHLQHVVATTFPEITVTLPVPEVLVSFQNQTRAIKAWGSEWQIKADLLPSLQGTLNYAYQDIKNGVDPLSAADGGPEHKVNLGLRFHKKGWTISGWMHWVGKSAWQQNELLPNVNDVGQVDAYTLVNGQIRYAFSGLLNGWTVGVGAFNLLDHVHYETLPSSAQGQGQRGEEVRRRLVGLVQVAF